MDVRNEPLKVLIDHGQWRRIRDRVSALSVGADPSFNYRDPNAMADPTTMGWCLKPLPFTPEWLTTFSGSYARLRKTDYTLITAANWEEHAKINDANVYLDSQGVDEPVVTNFNFARNQGVFIDHFNYSENNDKDAGIEFGWGDFDWEETVDHTGSYVSLKVKHSKVEVYRFGQLEGSYGWIDGGLLAFEKDQGHPREYYDMTVLVRRNQIVFLTSMGPGFVHTFTEFADDELDPELWPACPFWWHVMPGEEGDARATVQVAPIRHVDSAKVYFQSSWFIDAPDAANPFLPTKVFADTPAGTSASGLLVEPDAVTTPFVPNGVKFRARHRADLATSDNRYTPWVYALVTGTSPLIVRTDSSEVTTITREDTTGDYLLSAKWSQPDTRTGGESAIDSFEITLSDAFEEYIYGLRWMCNRPMRFQLGNLILMSARAGAPHKDEEMAVISADDINFTCQGWKKALEQATIKQPEPLDGMWISDAFRFVANLAGVPDEYLDIEWVNYTLPRSDKPGTGEFNLMMNAGDTCLYWWNKLYEDYVSHMIEGEYVTPSGPKLRLASRPTEPAMRLYLFLQDAMDIEGLSRHEAKRLVVTSKSGTVIPIEATQVWTEGLHPVDLKPILYAQRDLAAEDPELAPSARPRNWWGEPKPLGLINETLRDDEAVKRLNDLVFPRVTVPYQEFTIKVNDLPFKPDGCPLQRGDMVEIFPAGHYEIVEMPECNFSLEPIEVGTDEDGEPIYWYDRETHYTIRRELPMQMTEVPP